MWAGAQAVLAYRVPLAGSLDRPQRKILHAALHSAALLCIVLALVAAFQSHNLKRPTPTPNLYSPHSYLGLAVTILAFLQARSAYTLYLNLSAPHYSSTCTHRTPTSAWLSPSWRSCMRGAPLCPAVHVHLHRHCCDVWGTRVSPS